MPRREARIRRETRETRIALALGVDGTGAARMRTGLPFLERLLGFLCGAALFDLDLAASGDLQVDDHHLVEDIGLVLGDAFSRAMGEKTGVRRYGWAAVPLDAGRVEAVLDLSGRPYLNYGLEIRDPRIRRFDPQLMEEFSRAFCDRARLTLHLTQAAGKGDRRALEAAFTALGLALRQACAQDPRRQGSASTKGTLTA